MVKNFTNDDQVAYVSDREQKQVIDDQFEQKLKANLQKLSKDPSEKVLDNILKYSRSLSEQQ